METVQGLSDALYALGIPSKVVTSIQPESESLYIVLFASGEASDFIKDVYVQ